MKNIPLNKKIPALIFLLLLLYLAAPVLSETGKGSISISSNPKGADIYLNDEYINKTDQVITGVFPGIHYVRLEMDGYKTWEKIFEVKEGQTTILSHDMEASTGGAFSVTTKPKRAKIYIDGDYYGTSDTVLYNVPTGQHTFLLTLENYTDYQKTVTINEDMSQSLVHTFEPLPTKGRIVFESGPSGAKIYLNGEYVGDTKKTLDETEPGTYNVTIKKEGYDDWEGIVDVEARKISEVNVILNLSKVSFSVSTTPAGAKVYLDEENIGESPVTVSAVQGPHNLSVEKFGYESVEDRVYLGPFGASLSYTLVSMAPEAIEKAEDAVTANAEYNPERARNLLEKSKESYNSGNSEAAIGYAKESIEAAYDVDSDGVKNQDDISPNINNIVIYISPLFILAVFIFFIAGDVVKHRVSSGIKIEIIRPPENEKKGYAGERAYVTADIKGPYKAFVCTVYIDGEPVEHFTEAGRHNINISGRSFGAHLISVHLQAIKERYGKYEDKTEETFTIEPLKHTDEEQGPEITPGSSDPGSPEEKDEE
ncbi:hypothetical protein J2128_001361 [Methanomicrobium sp. W14]|uniref:PEGA domain-containing protein n=1 Tax=Methanomicrobium sp. W14 TaxID=2817839 RepID=UPI001AE51F3B|nr:PEGA domain-containing protein [Methanomicrobium sp. W14]MBP2133407.1 hypothetical protein [Methanomicrobium sp. W14]